MRKIIFVLLLVNSYFISSQNCEIKKDTYELLNVTVNDVKCLAKNYEGHTLVYSFGLWCQPCIIHLQGVLDLTKDYNLNLLILAVDKNQTNYAYTKKYLESKKEGITIMSLKNTYGKREFKRYKKFLTEITPEKFNNINGMSKHILLNNDGEVLMVTSYKDRLKGEDWENDKPILKRKIIPFLEK